MTQLLGVYQNQHLPAKTLRVAEALALEHSSSPDYLRQAGKLAMSTRQNKKAANYLARAYLFAPDPAVVVDLAILYLKNDQPDKAPTAGATGGGE